MATKRQKIAGFVIVALLLLYWKRSLLASAIYSTLPVNAQTYLSTFQKADVDNRLPPGMTGKIAMIESGFNPAAYNPSGATGIMQIIPAQHPDAIPTDPFLAITYAGQYLRKLYNRFGDWNKAIAAYNWGEGNLAKNISRNGENWYTYLPSETQKYIIKYNSIQSFT